MHTPNKNTAVLVFIRSEKEEAEAKKFGSCLSSAGNVQVATLLNKRVKLIAKQSGLPTVVIGGNQQNGANFGERFTDAVLQVFAQGYENVIAVGNDCLSISSGLLRRAALHLETKKIVLGPTEDGGVYLLGFQKSTFPTDQLKNLPWQTNRLFDALQCLSQRYPFDDILLFEMSIDADDAESFQKVINHLQSHFSFKKILKSLLQNSTIQQIYSAHFQLPLLLRSSLTHRGPPTFTFSPC